MSGQKIIQNPAKMSKAIPKKKADKNANSIAYYTVIKIKKTNSTDSLDDFKLDPEKKIPLLEIREKYKKSKLSTKSVKDQNSPQSSVTSVSQNLPTYAGKKYDAQDNSNNNKVEKEKLEPVSKEDQERESAIQDLSFNWFLWDNQLKVLRTIDRRKVPKMWQIRKKIREKWINASPRTRNHYIQIGTYNYEKNLRSPKKSSLKKTIH